MAIAMEFYNVIVPKSVILSKYPGGVEQYKKDARRAFLEDQYLTRTGAMNWHDVEYIIHHLEDRGIRYLDENGKPVEIIVVCMIRGPLTPCDWIDFDNGELGPRCWLRGTEPGELSKPEQPAKPEEIVIIQGDLTRPRLSTLPRKGTLPAE